MGKKYILLLKYRGRDGTETTNWSLHDNYDLAHWEAEGLRADSEKSSTKLISHLILKGKVVDNG